MIRTLVALAVAGLVTLAPALAPTPAQARDGGAIAAGVLGGLAAGAIIGSAAANARPAPPPVYYAPPPPPPHVVEEDCYYERGRVWDPYAGVWRRGPRRMVCD
jgi:hypothetical protein